MRSPENLSPFIRKSEFSGYIIRYPKRATSAEADLERIVREHLERVLLREDEPLELVGLLRRRLHGRLELAEVLLRELCRPDGAVVEEPPAPHSPRKNDFVASTDINRELASSSAF